MKIRVGSQQPAVSSRQSKELSRVVRIPPSIQETLRNIGRVADQQGVAAYAVGGCVRDWLLGMRTTDLDVTIEGRGIEVARAAAGALGGSVTVHQQFGTATVTITRASRIDFATCRRETYATSAAYPKVSPGTLEDDLFRRDFTINAMAMAMAPGAFGTLIDPFHGLRDLRRRILRVLHDRSFMDDPSRILRGIRFAQRLGLHWEPRTRRALQEALAAGALGWLNVGRLQRELNRMREEPNPVACFKQLAQLLNARVRKDRKR